jgi:hypothetical protein
MLLLGLDAARAGAALRVYDPRGFNNTLCKGAAAATHAELFAAICATTGGRWQEQQLLERYRHLYTAEQQHSATVSLARP